MARNSLLVIVLLFIMTSALGAATGDDPATSEPVGPEPTDGASPPLDLPGKAAAAPGVEPPRQTPPAVGFLADVDAAEFVFDGVLLEATVRQPEGTRILVTDYVFQVVEWIEGPLATRTVSLTSAGGELPDGSGMTVGDSLRLEPKRRYLVVTKPDHESLMLPMARVLQVAADGHEVADESGRLVTGLADGRLVVERSAVFRSLRYRPAATGEDGSQKQNVPPDGWTPPHGSEAGAQPAEFDPVSLHELIDLIGATRGTRRAPSAQGSVDTTGLEDPTPAYKWYWCGWILEPNNYYTYLPDDNNWSWWNDGAGNWNTLVDDNPSGPDWLVGYYTSGGNPIRDRNPVAWDGNNHTGMVSDTQLANGGYGGTWAGWGANGINFTWYSGVDCTEIVEVDSFVNPTLANDSEQFRKSMTHELGHALGLSTDQGHEDRCFALMYAGTWRQPPNYGSTWYGRMDDMSGERAFLNNANTHAANTWVLESWVDMAAWSQTHDNWGSPGNLIMADADTYSGYRGDSFTIRHLQIENRGNLPASNVLLSFYLSWNPTVSDIDYLTGTAWWSSFPEHGRWSNGNWTVTVPSDIPAGTYYIGWVLTLNDSERSTNNNTAVMLRDYYSGFSHRTFTVLGQPDLHISSVSTSSGSVPQGGWLTVNGTAHNQGDASSGGTTMRYYVSTNPTISTSDTQLATDFVPSLAPGGSSAGSAPVTLNVAPGDYWLGVCVDSVANEEFTNNQCSSGVAVQVTAADLIFANGFEDGSTSGWDGTVG